MNDHSSGCTAAASGSSQVNARPFRWSSRSAPPHSLDHDQPFSLAGRSACMGRFLSRGFPRGAYPIILTSCFLVRPVSPFPRPDPHDRVEPARAEAVKDGRVSAHRRLVLEGFEHDGTLERVGDDDVRGELRRGARSIVPHPCMRRAKDPNHDAGIRIGSKLRGGGPILTHGIEAMLTCGTPPPRTVIGDPSEACDRGRNRQVFLDRVLL